MKPDRPQVTTHGACVLHAGYAGLHARMHMHTPRTWAPPHARTHTCTHPRKHKQINTLTLIPFPRQQEFREGASVLRYAYIDCAV